MNKFLHKKNGRRLVFAFGLLILSVIFFTEKTNAQVSVTSTLGTSLSGLYPTLKTAFDSINVGYHQGDIEILITANTIEGSVIVKLDSSGTVNTGGTSSYTSILIKPSGGSFTITGNPAAGSPMIDLNGADHVTFDGLNNGIDSLTIVNNTVSTTSGTSTIRLINEACFNKLQRVKIMTGYTSSSLTAGGGGVFISNATGGTIGNDSNTITGCYFTNSSTTNTSFAYRFIMSIGSATNNDIQNSGTIISNNDFVNSRSSGVLLGGGNRDAVISDNHFYHNVTMASAGSAFSPIYVSNNASGRGENFHITNNYIGGTDRFCGGTKSSIPLTINYQVIYLSCATSAPSYINGNTISNISISSTYNSTETGLMYIRDGRVDIGTTAGNTIGSMTDTGAVEIIHNATSGGNYMVFAFGGNTSGVVFDTIRLENNMIGGITLRAINTNTPSFRVLDNTGTSGVFIIKNNFIGSPGIPHSIKCIGNNGNMFGFIHRNSNPNQNEFKGNYIGNLTHFSTASAAGNLVGISMGSTSNWNVDSNTFENLISYTGNAVVANNQAAAIVFKPTGTLSNTVIGNTIRNIVATHPTAISNVYGMDLGGRASNTIVVAGNQLSNIHSLSADSANVFGIRIVTILGGKYVLSNNQINMGRDTLGASVLNGNKAYGIYSGTGLHTYYHNSVLVEGIAVSNLSSSYAFYAENDSFDVRNNVFVNTRSFNSGSVSKYNYATAFDGVLTLGAFDMANVNYNLYYANGVNGAVVGNGTSVYADLLSWKAVATGHDFNSVNGNPDFISSDSLKGGMFSSITYGDASTGIAIDITGTTRSRYLMGAYDETGTLPVTWGMFIGKDINADVQLVWSTASEINNKGFEIERSLDGKIFELVGFVKGAGNSGVQRRYNFTDWNVLGSVNRVYYRLKQLDMDGKFNHSTIVTITKGKQTTNTNVSVSPNPFTNQLTTDLYVGEQGIAQIVISDINGREVYSESINVNIGMNTINIANAIELKSGVYFMNITTNAYTGNIKLIKP